MAGTIKGIVVEIGGDTSGLQKALSKVNSSTSSLSKELRGINSLLKLDPKNTELLSQKQEVLSKNIQETSEKLKLLKQTQEQADEAIANGTKISDENYRNLQREIINTENKLNNFKAQASNWSRVSQSLEAISDKFSNISKKLDTLGSNLTTTLTLPVLAVGTAALTTGNSFEAQMSRVQAIAGATGDELDKLTEQAMQLGSETSFSATQVAEGMENLASAGFTTEEIMSAMPGLLDLAASSGAELATSSEIAASAIRGFGLEASEAGHVADIFAEAAARTNAQTEDMGEAMKYIAPVANTMGLKIEEVAAAIGIMSDAGIKGSQAGTTLRGALTRLTKPTDKMLGVMEDLGISFYDNEGKMKSLTEIIGMLQDATKDLTDEQEQNALTTLFGTESLSGMVALINRGSDDLSDLTKSFEKCDGSASDMADTMLDNTAGALESLSGSLETAGIAIQKALAPEIKKLASWIQGLVDDFSNLSDEQQLNILKIVGLVAAIGPAVKIVSKLSSGISTVSKGLGTFAQAIAVANNKAISASTSVNNMAKVISGLTSPLGIAAIGLTTSIGLIITAVNNMTKATEESFSNVGTAATDFVAGINNAESHLDEFNSTLFASSEEQQKLEQDMQSVQDGITTICKTASDERRGYTQEEITQLNDYFKKLRELKDRELEIQQSIAGAITQQAVQNAQSFQGSLEQYKINSQEWIKTAQDQANAQIKIINEGATQEIALLQQKYGEKATLDNENYAAEYNKVIERKNQRIAQANDEVAKVNAAYSSGYLERSKQEDGFYNTIKTYADKQETMLNNHNTKIQQIKDGELWYVTNKNQAIQSENDTFAFHQQETWNQMYEDMDESQEQQLGVWLAMVAQTEMYGGEIDDETKKTVDSILASYDSMPKETKEAMKNAMEPMLTEMKNKEPSLFAQASNIANGILGRLKTAFDIHSPSRKTKEIFQNVMKGAELGLKSEKNSLNKEIDMISSDTLKKLSQTPIRLNKMNSLNSKIVDSTQTIFTTPQIVFNVQELDEAKLQQCFNYVNRKFGSQY